MTYYITSIKMKKGCKSSISPKDIEALELVDAALVKHKDCRKWWNIEDIIWTMKNDIKRKSISPMKLHPYFKGSMKLWTVPWTATDGSEYLRTEHVRDATSDPLMRLPRA